MFLKECGFGGLVGMFSGFVDFVLVFEFAWVKVGKWIHVSLYIPVW